jgi:rhodanese-related sulfurtransferase
MKGMPFLVLLLALFFFGPGSIYAVEQTTNDPEISGEVVDGLRLLDIGPNQTANQFVVFRGDYIQPRLTDSSSFEIVIPELSVKKTFPVTDGSKPYIKMKKPGRYSFTAGDQSGTIEVIEYSATHYTELSAVEADKFIQNVRPLILDVRTPGEFQSGHIKGAVLIPVQVLQKQLSSLAPNKQREILIYCASGNRSTVASRILINNGFEKISNLRYGINDWAKRNFPIER